MGRRDMAGRKQWERPEPMRRRLAGGTYSILVAIA